MGHVIQSCDHSTAGDWHMAYILIYGPEQVEVMSEEEPMSS